VTFAKLSQSDKMPSPAENKGKDGMSQQLHSPAGQGFATPQPPKSGMLQEVFTLQEGAVTLTFPEALSVASYDDLKDYFDLFLRKAKRRAVGVPPFVGGLPSPPAILGGELETEVQPEPEKPLKRRI
jgi:hypothetical protein